LSDIQWPITGLGVSLYDIRDMLDAEKIRALLQKHSTGVLDESHEEFQEYQNASNEDRFDLLECDLEESNDFTCGFLAMDDERNLLVSANDNEGGFYLMYEPSYPWERRDNDFTSEEDARQYICDFLMRFMLPEVTAEQVQEKIDFIKEIGSENYVIEAGG